MGFFSRLKAAFSPAKLTGTARVVADKPLHEQFQRLGGGLTPFEVSNILRMADAGQPERLVDLANESRQKDCHMQSVCATREQAVALTDLDFIEPENATAKEKDAVVLCRRTRDDFRNWPTLIEHLAGSFMPGHGTAELPWHKTNDGLLLPYEAKPIHAREFIFARGTGALRYRRSVGDTVGVDLLAENPGRIIQVQRRIVGDVPAREGLMRVLIWTALFRNWTLKDWLALGEVGWKPWRFGKYQAGAHQKDIDALVRALERVGSDGIAAFPDTTDMRAEWPKGSGPGGASVHRELFDAMGREMSKATIGSATTLEAGPNGDRASTETRDKVRTDIREADCRAVASALYQHLFRPVVAVNLGADVRCPVPWFQTEETADQKEFAEAVSTLVQAGLRVPAKWVRDEIGMPEPIEGEETLEKTQVAVPANVGDDEDDDASDEESGNDDEAADDDQDTEKRLEQRQRRKAESDNESGAKDGLDYVDRLTESVKAAGARALAPTVAAMMTQIAQATGYEDALRRIEGRYGELASPADLKVLTEADIILANLAGAAAVREDTPELEDET